ncbi:MAG: threonine synthase [Treponema sp.]|nr:threonine synthase [Treponema sp.]
MSDGSGRVHGNYYSNEAVIAAILGTENGVRYISTKKSTETFSFSQAALAGLAPDGGLFIPQAIPVYGESVKKSLHSMAFLEVALETIRPYVEGEIPGPTLEDLCAGAFSFAAPLVQVESEDQSTPLVLELFHGPTAAFKDFGARFMARTFSWLRRGEDRPLRILVATSGDTGGAVADGFFGIEGISVTILYPKGRVSELQEKQIAGLGGNISALAVEGNFDDCQSLVKAAFGDSALQKQVVLSSANSINISRLIPQAVYYAAAAGKARVGFWDSDGDATPRAVQPAARASPTAAGTPRPVTICVPSGNFGNLTAGLYALSMGAPITTLVAATNINKTVPDYLESGEYQTRLSQETISNAMDVGAPSNFERMTAHWDIAQLRRMILGFSVTDDETRQTMAAVYRNYGYYTDPHSAVGWTAVQKLSAGPAVPGAMIVAATAHPAKFSETAENITGPVPIPASIEKAMNRTARALTIPPDISVLRDFLLSKP